MKRPAAGAGPRVALVSMHLDPLGRSPDDLLAGGWRDFGRSGAAAEQAGARVTLVQAAFANAERQVGGIRCSFVRGRGRHLLDRVAALSPDVIHYEGLVLPRELRALAGALPRVPILAQDHGSRCPTGWRRWWYRWGFRPLSGVAFTARTQAAPFVAAGVLRPDLPVFEVVETSSDFTPGSQIVARAVTGLDGDPCLLWVGNLDANKDPLTVLDGVAAAAAALPALRLHMFFQAAPLGDAVAARIRQDPLLAPRVKLVGAALRKRMEALFRAADFLLQASHKEGSGVALIEALACGTTPIVTDIPSFRRITDDGRVGALVPVGDGAGFAAALLDWCGRDRATLRRCAREYFQRELSFEALGRQLRAAYDALTPTRS